MAYDHFLLILLTKASHIGVGKDSGFKGGTPKSQDKRHNGCKKRKNWGPLMQAISHCIINQSKKSEPN